jgi:lipoyl(octanoyl) transferase 2
MSSASRILNCLRLGRISFQRALDVQHACASMLLSDGQRDWSRRNGILLVLEHDPVYTTGLRSDRYPSGVEQALRERGADFHRTNRGGLITFHGPGQLVAYPILNLKQMGLTIRTYVDRLEGAMMKTCSRLGVQAERHAKYTGVWVGKSKIGAIG